MFHRRGLTVRGDEDSPPPQAPDPLAGCIQIALGLGQREWQEPALAIGGLAPLPTSWGDADEPPRPGPRDPPLCAIARGVNVHAGVVVPAGDRAALERLVRYLLRPALSLRRLSLRDDGAAVYRLQRPDRHGRTSLVMTPLELLARLAAILPAPRLALRRQLGVFAPASLDRRRIMPRRSLATASLVTPPVPHESCHPKSSVPTRVPWAELLRRVWHIDALRCDRCGGRLRPVALVQDLAEAERYLLARGEFAPVPRPARSRGPPAAAA